MLDAITVVAQAIGFLVLVWIAIAVFCLMVLTVCVTVSVWKLFKSSKYGRHVSSAEELLKLSDEEEAQLRRESKEKQERKDAFDLEELRKKLTSPPEQWEDLDRNYTGPTSFSDQTEIYPPFSNQEGEVLDSRGAHKA
jgi:Tfp pilus assembly protein PilO